MGRALDWGRMGQRCHEGDLEENEPRGDFNLEVGREER